MRLEITIITIIRGKCNVGRRYDLQDRVSQAKHFDSSFVKIDQQIRVIGV